jgi:integrase
VGEERKKVMKNTQGRVFARGQIFWVAYYLRGVEFRESARTTDAVEAKRFLKNRLRETGADLMGLQKFATPKASKLTVAQLVDSLKADFELREKLSEQNACNLRRVAKDFGDYKAALLTSEIVDNYIGERVANGDKPASINRTTQLLNQSYTLAKRRGTLSHAPYIRHLSEAGNARQGFFTEQELAAVIELLPADLKDFTAFAACTGMRKGEISSLRWSDVDGDTLKLRGEDAKNGFDRNIPLTGELAEIIERRGGVRQTKIKGVSQLCEFIFHRKGKQVGRFNKAWATACDTAGVPDKLFHDLRRFAVRSLSRAGTPQNVAMKISGHRTASMFARYNIVDTADIRTALLQTEKFRREQAATPRVLHMGANKG